MATKSPYQRLTLNQFNGLSKDWVIKGGEQFYNKKAPADKFIRASVVYPLFIAGEVISGYQTKVLTNNSVVTTDITDFAIDQVTATSAPVAYGIGDQLLYKINTTSTPFDTVVNNTPATPTWPHTIVGATTTVGYQNDCLTTYLNIGGNQVYCLLYAYNVDPTAGTAKMGLFDITNNSNWGGGNSSDTAYTLSTNTIVRSGGGTDLGVPHPMVYGTNAIVYIGCGYVVDSLDTTVSSATIVNNAIDIPQNYEIQTLAFYKGFLVIGAQLKSTTVTRHGGSAIFFWDTFSPSFADEILIDDDFCGTLYNDGVNLWLFTGNANYGNIRRWDGQQFAIQQQTTSNIPKHNNITPLRNGFAYGGGVQIFWYGEVIPGTEYSLWNIYSVGSVISCVKKLNPTNDTLHLGGDSAGTEFIRQSDFTKFETGTGTWPTINFGHRVTIHQITIYYNLLATGASGRLEYWPNLGTDGLVTPYGTISFAGDGASTYKIFRNQIQNINTLNLQFTWDGSDAANQVCIEQIDIDFHSLDTTATS